LKKDQGVPAPWYPVRFMHQVLPHRGDTMTQHAKVVLDKWVFRAIWVVLVVTTTGFVAKMMGVM
jgi:hypothetical protein